MRPLIDCDILRYEVGAAGQFLNEDGELVARNFDKVSQALDDKIDEICALVWATEEPLLFLSMDARTKKRHARKVDRTIKRLEKDVEGEGVKEEIARLEEEKVYKPNFREDVAKKKGYKNNRKSSEKPLHYDNLTEYILANYECVMAEGLEADDLLSVYQRNALELHGEPTTIICSRDKDLKITPGLHFSWECGRQKQFGPELVTELGRIIPIFRGKNAKGEPKLPEVKGTGIMFFGVQLLTGDSTDNIPGLPGCGPVKAYNTLKDCTSTEDIYKAVAELYKAKFEDSWEEEMLEQGRLLWMVAELDEDGLPVMWEIPECIKEV